MASRAAVETAAITLSGQQLAFYRALAEKSESLASMYYGALLVLGSTANPERFALAAHGLRELMEKLPSHLDVAMPAHDESLMKKVREVENAWKYFVKNGRRNSPADWQGPIEGPLQRFLIRLDEFFCWFRDHMPRRKEEVLCVLRKLDRPNRPLPQLLEERSLKQWVEMREFFQKVSHHRKDCAQVEFDDSVGALERFLLERLVPRTFDDFAEIDAILGAK